MSATPPVKISVIDSALGIRAVVCAFLSLEWPDAAIEVAESGSPRAANSQVIVLGTEESVGETLRVIADFAALENCPPIVLLMPREMLAEANTFVAAGVKAVLFRDALSKHSLCSAIGHLLLAGHGAEPSRPGIKAFGQFSFIAKGQYHDPLIEHVRFVAILASSNLAQVFAAERIADRRRVVVKIPLNAPHQSPEVHTFCERLRFFMGLNGHHVVRYLDVGISEQWPYVVLEHLTGGDLRRRMASDIAPPEALRILGQLSDALATIHSGRFAHMDLKPESIFFRDDALVLIDFNISARFGSTALNHATGDILGTPYYMSPEQAQGKTIDAQTDLYSAGVIFFEMLTGHQPYIAESAIQVAFKHIHDEIPLLPKPVRGYQPIVDSLMAKERGERLKTAEELSAMLVPYLNGEISPAFD